MLKSRSFQYYAFAHDCIRCVTIVGCWQLRLFISLVTNCQSFEPLSLANLCVFDKISQCPQNILIHTRASNWPKKFASKPRAHSSAKFLVKFIGLIKFNLLSRCTEFRWVFFVIFSRVGFPVCVNAVLMARNRKFEVLNIMFLSWMSIFGRFFAERLIIKRFR